METNIFVCECGIASDLLQILAFIQFQCVSACVHMESPWQHVEPNVLPVFMSEHYAECSRTCNFPGLSIIPMMLQRLSDKRGTSFTFFFKYNIHLRDLE